MPGAGGLALGVVEAINGARRLNCRFTGEAGHAGTVPMLHRKDAPPRRRNGWCRWKTRPGSAAVTGGDLSAPCAVRRAR